MTRFQGIARFVCALVFVSLGAGTSLAQPVVLEGVVPQAPPACTDAGAVFSSSPDADINDEANTSDEIDVSGLSGPIWDVNLVTDITHTYPGDLEITLTSPSGTVVTISTDNGGDNDDVFAGTVWDDQGTPQGPVTDASFSDGVVETPLVVEEALAAVNGEDPNGTWTLDVFDDAEGDTGTLNSWSLEITTLDATPATRTESFEAVTALPITDNATTEATIDVEGLPFVCDLNLVTDITHTWAGDLEITLTSPSGTAVTVTTDNGGSNDDVFAGTVWDDQGDPQGPVTDASFSNGVVETPLVVEGALAAFNGENPSGAWTLSVHDDALADQGTLVSWGLEVTTCSCLEFAGLCGAEPQDCRQPLQVDKAKLGLKNGNNPKLKFTAKVLEGTPDEALGDPEDDTDYSFCLYDNGELVQEAQAPAGADWKAKDGKVKYKSKSDGAGGLKKVMVQAGQPGDPKVKVLGKGADLQNPAGPLAGPVTGQVVNSLGECWGATFTEPKKNDADKYKAKGN